MAGQPGYLVPCRSGREHYIGSGEVDEALWERYHRETDEDGNEHPESTREYVAVELATRREEAIAARRGYRIGAVCG